MNRLLIGIGALGAAVLTGCATIDRSETESLSDIASNSSLEEVKEPPVPEIPDYRPLIGKVDVSAKVCVYRTLWFSDILEEFLGKNGYVIVPIAQDKRALIAERPHFIVEPLSFKHTVENRKHAKWLYTRLAVQVRAPLEAAFGETGVGLASAPRIFQVYARSKLSADSSVGENEYKENTTKAISNLMCIQEFRDALTCVASDKAVKIKPLADFIVTKPEQKAQIGVDEGIPSQYLSLKPSFAALPKRQAQPPRTKEAMVGVWKSESNLESWSMISGKMHSNKLLFKYIYTLRADGSASYEFLSNGSRSVFEGSWTYENGMLLTKLLGKDGKTYDISLLIVWYDDSHIEIRKGNLDEYRRSLLVGGVKRASVLYDDDGNLKTYMEITGATPVFMIESAPVYVRVKE